MQALQLQQKTATHRQALGDRQQRIQKMLLWTDLQYSTFIFETGMEYLELYIPTDRDGIDILSRSTIFWNWWKNHWDIRDMQYLADTDYNLSYLTLRSLYKYRHNAEHL